MSGDAAGVPDDETNLARRAASAWLDAAGSGFAGGLTIRLTKQIPAGAGLGGGSSDAGAVLRLLEAEHGSIGREALARIAARLGADVPFFVAGHALALGRGRGDLVEALPGTPPREVVLILPGTVHDTGRVFARVSHLGRSGRLEDARAALEAGDAAGMRAAHHNALKGPAIRAYPAFGTLLEEVERRLGRPPAMTGTGSTLYDLPDPGEAQDVLRRLEGLDARCLVV